MNLDVNVADDCPKCELVNLEETPLPFSDKQFDVALASHTLEHLANWQQALTEWSRIAEHVVIVLPNPLSINSYFNPLHKQHFSLGDMTYIRAHWSNVEVFT
jgi:ubiquinone/menaquinone biosynthesis C-methylase UbiE